MSVCGRCNAYDPVNSGRGLCKARAPQAFFMGMQPVGPMLAGNRRAMQPVTGTFYPEVGQDDVACREFQVKGDVKPFKFEQQGPAMKVTDGERIVP